MSKDSLCEFKSGLVERLYSPIQCKRKAWYDSSWPFGRLNPLLGRIFWQSKIRIVDCNLIVSKGQRGDFVLSLSIRLMLSSWLATPHLLRPHSL
jgi:hypothetical protein